MEQYYVPLSITLLDDTEFAIKWNGQNYRVFTTCPIRPESGETNEPYIEISPWGYTVDSGNYPIQPNETLLVGEGCEANDFNVGQVVLSRHIWDAPNMTPYEPIYFGMLFVLTIWMFKSAFNIMLGRGLKL